MPTGTKQIHRAVQPAATRAAVNTASSSSCPTVTDRKAISPSMNPRSGRVPNDLIAGSGAKLALKPLDAPYSAPLPLGGSHRSFTPHPSVFMTADELKDMASRIGRPGSYSMRLANIGLRRPNESTRCGKECSRIVYSERIGPPQPNFIFSPSLARTPQPSEFVCRSGDSSCVQKLFP
jgi:hypothetical protein